MKTGYSARLVIVGSLIDMSLSIASREPTFRVATIEDADVVIDRLVYSLTTVEPVSASLQLDHHDVRTFYEGLTK